MTQVIKDCGIRNYSIFFRKDGTLFFYLETDDFEKAMAEIKQKDIYHRWQKHMEKYFIKEDKSVVGPEMEMLEEVFHLG